MKVPHHSQKLKTKEAIIAAKFAKWGTHKKALWWCIALSPLAFTVMGALEANLVYNFAGYGFMGVLIVLGLLHLREEDGSSIYSGRIRIPARAPSSERTVEIVAVLLVATSILVPAVIMPALAPVKTPTVPAGTVVTTTTTSVNRTLFAEYSNFTEILATQNTPIRQASTVACNKTSQVTVSTAAFAKDIIKGAPVYEVNATSAYEFYQVNPSGIGCLTTSIPITQSNPYELFFTMILLGMAFVIAVLFAVLLLEINRW